METSIRPVVSVWVQENRQWNNVEDAGTRSLDNVREFVRTGKVPPSLAEVRVCIENRIFTSGIENLKRVDTFVDQCVRDAQLEGKVKPWVWSSECKKVEQQDLNEIKAGKSKKD
jgi:hypothetical protein